MGTAVIDTKHGTEFARWLDNYTPFDAQRRFNDCGARYKGFSGPIGTGKTLALAWEGIQLAYANSGLPGLIGAITYRMLEDVTKKTFLEVLEDENIPYTHQKGDNKVTFTECGSEVFFRSLGDPNKLRGPNLAWYGCDELSYAEESSWNVLEGRLRHPKSTHPCGFGAWTPKGFNWTWRRFVSDKKLPEHEIVLARPSENRAVLDRNPLFYERLKHSYDERFYRQEVLGEYLSVFSGQVYYSFERDRNVREVKYNPLLPIRWDAGFQHQSGVFADLPGPRERSS